MDYDFTPSQRNALNTVLDQLIVLAEPDAVYCFGMRQATAKSYNAFVLSAIKQQHVHFYLLVITKNNGGNLTADASDCIKIKSEGCIKTTLLIHAPHQVLYPKGSQKHFFERITANAKLVYGSTAYQKPEAVAGKPPGLSYSKTYWAYRLKTARALLDAEKALKDKTVLQVNASLLHLATEHLYLGLIAVFSGYRPNHFSLGYLFDLCEILCPEAISLFPRNSEEERRLFKILSLHLSQMRHSDRHGISKADIEVIKSRLARIIINAAGLAEAEIGRVEGLFATDSNIQNN